ncbi:hypothetical protein TrLO_g15061 [Triparma laevis f. longispina]|uniref:tRNA (guanine(9)-N(1))-methyltransferase n=1 Tax=Triparma laevis f. longispina TaxID=1714387 RepID=A0A9W7FUK2_9STRA|nr:hypothetical protein TrLO_g15061 [Triparma laevis f. longispina]
MSSKSPSKIPHQSHRPPPKAKIAPPVAKPYTDTDGTIYPSKKAWKKSVKDATYELQKMVKRKKEKEEKRERREERERVEKEEMEKETEEERRGREERQLTAQKDRQKKIATQKADRLLKASSTFKITIDCSFETSMVSKERLSLSKQIIHCHAYNKRQVNPVRLDVVGLEGESRRGVEKMDGFPGSWGLFEDLTSIDKEGAVYLTADSENVIEELDPTKNYIIGGIVDRNRLKNFAIDRAKALHVEHGRLPINEHLEMTATKVLTVNHVFEILCRRRDVGWGDALLNTLPERKKAVCVEGEGEGGEDFKEDSKEDFKT